MENEINADFSTKKKNPRKEYVLRLYVAGMHPRSLHAITVIQKVCEEHLRDRYDLQIIDIYTQPDLAKADQIIAVPTLIRAHPEPFRRFIGDLSMMEAVLSGLEIKIKRNG